jgi:hypothetical protein
MQIVFSKMDVLSKADAHADLASQLGLPVPTLNTAVKTREAIEKKKVTSSMGLYPSSRNHRNIRHWRKWILLLLHVQARDISIDGTIIRDKAL